MGQTIDDDWGNSVSIHSFIQSIHQSINQSINGRIPLDMDKMKLDVIAVNVHEKRRAVAYSFVLTVGRPLKSGSPVFAPSKNPIQ